VQPVRAAAIELAVSTVPDGVGCVEIDLAGLAGKQSELIGLKQEVHSAQQLIDNLQEGPVEINGSAFPSSCAEVDPSTPPTWTSDPIHAVLKAGTVVPVDLELHQSGAISVSVSFGVQPDPALFDITDLGSLSPVGQTIAYGINNAGTVVGFSMNGAGCCAQAFDTERDPIYLFPEFPITYAMAINPAGTVAGMIDISGGGGCYEAMTFTRTIGPTSIGLLGGFPCSQGLAIDQREDVAGVAADSTRQRAFLRSWRGPQLMDLGTLGGNSAAYGVIDVVGNQTVVGTSVPPGYVPPGDPWRVGHAFVWHEDTGMRDLNGLSFLAGTATPVLAGGVELLKASAIVGIGHVFGHAAFADGTIHAFHLDPRSDGYDFFDLGTFGGGVGYALAANDALTAVGSSGGTALLFVNGKVVDLEGALALFDRLHWTLAEATGINANCEIVGWGNHDGSTRAFKLSPRPGFRCPAVR
jgi:hypothetical protein